MKNAHERFGFAEFEKRLKDTTTRIRLTADCFIGEPANKSGASQGHLLSVFGTDVEVAALWAAVLGEERISVGGPGMMPYLVMFGERPGVYRGTLTLPGRRRPIRHLVVLSTQFRAEGRPGPDYCQRKFAGSDSAGRRQLPWPAIACKLGRMVLRPSPQGWPDAAIVRAKLRARHDPGHQGRVP